MRTLPPTKQKIQMLRLALGLLSSFFVIELGVGLWIHSLSLVADAGHMLSDIAALGLTLVTSWIAQRVQRYQLKCSSWRVELLAALINSLSLVVLASWVATEAILRLQSQTTEIVSLPMLVTAVVGLGVNGFNALWLHECSHHDLNYRAAFLHVLSDLFSSVGVILAAIAISWLGWMWADGAISLLVSALIVVSALPLVTQSSRLLLDKTAPTDRLTCNCNRQDSEKLLFPSLEEILQ